MALPPLRVRTKKKVENLQQRIAELNHMRTYWKCKSCVDKKINFLKTQLNEILKAIENDDKKRNDNSTSV